MCPPTVKTRSHERVKGKQYTIQEKILETMGTNNEVTQIPTISLRITAFTSQGGRNYMEDQVSMSYVPCPDDPERVAYFYAGIFDGHGGEEAAKYAKKHLMWHIVQHKEFWLNEDEKTLEAIKLGYMSLQRTMMEFQQREIWDPTHNGYKSTSGTTATICIFRDGKLFIGHVGDSRVVVGRQQPGKGILYPWLSEQLTKDHKPEDPEEEARILKDGGKVMLSRGVHRVVWKRPKDTNRMDTEMDEIPFLAVARSLGDFWSYNPANDSFIVSPEPDVKMLALNANDHRCVILASDGIWGMMSSKESVLYVQKAEILRARAIKEQKGHYLRQSGHSPSQLIGREALKRWGGRRVRADNISVITIILEDPRESSHSYVPVTPEPIYHAMDPIENALQNEDLYSSDVSSSDGDTGHMDSDVTTNIIQAITGSLELQEPDVTSSSNVVSKPRKKAPRTPSPDITAPLWSMERRHSSAFQRFRRRTPGHGLSCSPTTVRQVGENGETVGTVGTPQRRRLTQNKIGTPVRRRIQSSFSDVADKVMKSEAELKIPEKAVQSQSTRSRRTPTTSHGPVQSQSTRSRRTPKTSDGDGPVHAQKKRRIQSMPLPLPALKKRKSPRRTSGPIIVTGELPVPLDLEFAIASPFCRVTRSQMKKYRC